MTAGGRPLRFLVVVLVGWTTVRVAVLWPPTKAAADAIDRLAAAKRPVRGNAAKAVERRSPRTRAAGNVAILPMLAGAPVMRQPPSPGPRPVVRPAIAPLRFDAAKPAPAGSILSPDIGAQRAARRVGLPLAPRAPVPSARWSGSGWFVLRGDGAPGAAFGGSQLGGSQAGARFAYAIDPAHRLQLVARVATPLRGRGREAAIGVEWQPTPVPVRVIAEHRVAIDGGKGGPTIGVIGGVGPAAVAPGVTLEAYGQAGAIARGGVEGFVDGAARLAHPVAAIGKVRFDLGAGAWGAAQRAAARLDAGPSLAADLPLGRRAHVRVALDWRARIAGDARPGSGLVLSLGTDF